MPNKFDNKIVIQNNIEAPEYKINKEEALNLSNYGSIRMSGRIDGGEEGACYNNSLSKCLEYQNRYKSLYCLGFACGNKGEYQPHAWIKLDEKYLEVTPQGPENESLTDYILCYAMSIPDIILLLKKNKIENAVAPMINRTGMIILCNA